MKQDVSKERGYDNGVVVDRELLHRLLSKVRVEREFIKVQIQSLSEQIKQNETHLDQIVEVVTVLEGALS